MADMWPGVGVGVPPPSLPSHCANVVAIVSTNIDLVTMCPPPLYSVSGVIMLQL